ncbi:MAG: glycosyltransferase family 39 protein, partial [Deltaproteobacteria bacterium]|nr:glycosyltransferase family 39 protein [Deltaproteobacteria bacterium]
MFERLCNTKNLTITLFSAAAILVLTNIGIYGLFDPWEMNRTHIARRMASPPSVLVIGKGVDSGLAGRLRDSLGGDFTVEGESLQAAREHLNGKVYDSVVLEVGELKTAQQSGTKEFASFLISAAPKNRSTQFILFAEKGSVPPGEILESVRQAAISSFPEKLKENAQGEDQDETVIDVEKEVTAALNIMEEPPVDYDELESLLRGRSLPHLFKAEFKSQGETLHIPVLEPLLTALFFKVFGFSEFSARLSQAFFGLLLLFITFYFTRRLFGGETGNLSAFILLTTPVFLAP